MTKRRNFSVKFKTTVALEAVCGDKMVQEIAARRQLYTTQVSTWKLQAIEGMAGVFSDKLKKAEIKQGGIKELHAKIGQLAVENNFLSQGLKRLARPLPDSRYAVSMRGGTPRDDPEREHRSEPDAPV